ncbi:hypothetical protein BDR26DRAFT_870368 [Obelidium mucronatum]|nr:hypothetical protein BDR26DRAFT_870368 [Obelidium mucronatum]
MGYDTMYYGAIKFANPLPLSVRLQYLALRDQSRHRLPNSKLPKGPLHFHLVAENNTEAYSDEAYEFKLLSIKEPVLSLLVFQDYLKGQDNKNHLEWLKYSLKWFMNKGYSGSGHWCFHGDDEADRYEVKIIDAVAFISSELRYAPAEPKAKVGEKRKLSETTDDEDDEDDDSEDDEYVDPTTSITVMECKKWETECRKLLVEVQRYEVNLEKLESPFESMFFEHLKTAINARELEYYAARAFGNPNVSLEYKELLLGQLVELPSVNCEGEMFAKDLSFCKRLTRINIDGKLLTVLEDAGSIIAINCPTIREVTIEETYSKTPPSTSELIQFICSLNTLPLLKLTVNGLSRCSQSDVFKMLELFPAGLESFDVSLGRENHISKFGVAPKDLDPLQMLLMNGFGGLFGPRLGGTQRVNGVRNSGGESLQGQWLQKIAQLPCATTLKVLDLGGVVFTTDDLTSVFVDPFQAESGETSFSFPKSEHVTVNRPTLRFRLAHVPSVSHWIE